MTAVPEAEGADPVGAKVVRSVSLGVLHRNDRYPRLYWQTSCRSIPPEKSVRTW